MGESPNKNVFNVLYGVGVHHRCENNVKKKKKYETKVLIL